MRDTQDVGSWPWKAAAAGLLLALPISFGCSGRKTPVQVISAVPQQDRQAVGSAVYPIGAGGKAEIYHQGYGVRKVHGVGVPCLRIQLSAENDGPDKVSILAGEAKLVDNRGDTLLLGAVERDGEPTPSVVDLEAGSHGQLDLFFDLPQGYDMNRVENFRIYWGCKVGGQASMHDTLFVRKDPQNMYWIDERGRRVAYRYYMAVKS